MRAWFDTFTRSAGPFTHGRSWDTSPSRQSRAFLVPSSPRGLAHPRATASIILYHPWQSPFTPLLEETPSALAAHPAAGMISANATTFWTDDTARLPFALR